MRMMLGWGMVSPRSTVKAFGDPLSMTYYDPDHSLEERYITIGHSDSGQLLMVAHTDRGDSIRIISARRSTRSERRAYEEQ
jgi:uncharacterized DUF497 family protein